MVFFFFAVRYFVCLCVFVVDRNNNIVFTNSNVVYSCYRTFLLVHRVNFISFFFVSGKLALILRELNLERKEVKNKAIHFLLVHL